MSVPGPNTAPASEEVNQFFLGRSDFVSYATEKGGRRFSVILYDPKKIEVTGRAKDLIGQLVESAEPEVPAEQGYRPEPLIPPVPLVKVIDGVLGAGPSKSEGWQGPMPEEQP